MRVRMQCPNTKQLEEEQTSENVPGLIANLLRRIGLEEFLQSQPRHTRHGQHPLASQFKEDFGDTYEAEGAKPFAKVLNIGGFFQVIGFLKNTSFGFLDD